ncbi:hypothetical protein [Sphingobacterium deserti]|uniref:Uncharacterized protein n=1 Tax=Sphingobacterium deserti TaxID=1229276 RepID=A0A0B8TCW4_9SPHI|nr:hypothetical protein [Sphingobacterium deserti]KGE16220.1 hypothetical protein DI53_0053 [Sphingobacterium deserti]
MRIAKNSEGYRAPSTNVLAVNGYGKTIEKCKADIFKGIEITKTLSGRYTTMPADLKSPELISGLK